MKTKERHNIAGIALVALTAIALPLQMVGAEENDKPEWKVSIEATDHVAETRMVELAKIPLEHAIRTALEKVAGKPVKAELESEDGYLIYAVEIVTPEGKVMEVILDPTDGKVLSVEDESAEQDGAADKESDNEGTD